MFKCIIQDSYFHFVVIEKFTKNDLNFELIFFSSKLKVGKMGMDSPILKDFIRTCFWSIIR